MTHLTPSTHDPRVAHEAHDRIAVAAYACGDAEGAELATAAALVAECAECASLHRDLRSIATATAATPAPVRPRDFRITEAQAARLRPAGWRRLLAPFASPRFAFAGPLGGGLAAIGLAGVLVAGGIGIPFGAGGSAAAPERAPVEAAGSDQAPKDAAVTMVPTMNDGAIGQGGAGTSAPGVTGQGDVVTPQAPLGSDDATRQDGATDQEYAMPDTTPVPQPETPAPVLPLAALLALVGGSALGGLRLVARRVIG